MNTATRSGASTSKSSNRQRLIGAALDAIADVGYASTSVSEIVQRAGLSRGMIHLHFKGKEALIAEAAQRASDDYYAQLEKHLRFALPGPSGVIRAVVACDLSAEVMNTRTVGIWYELRGAARTSSAIAAHSDTRGGLLEEVMISAFRNLSLRNATRPSEALARDAMRGTIALLDGIWTDFMLHSEGYDVIGANRTIFRFLRGLFPHEFASEGPPLDTNLDLAVELGAHVDGTTER